MSTKLGLDVAMIRRGRTAAQQVADLVQEYISERTTVAVERTVLRLFGVDGVTPDGVPLPNVIADEVLAAGRLSGGVARVFVNGLIQTGLSVQDLAEAIADGSVRVGELAQAPEATVTAKARELAAAGLDVIANNRQTRTDYVARLGEGSQPYVYVIVATGNIYEDVVQARSAARQGADIIAVIRSTGQSLIDYVPYGATTEGFGGTYATQENFRIMRTALDEVGEEVGRYIRLCNYCSGLCMPEIAAMGALERLDVMLNDALYGILFRDINMQRTLVDQYFSRMVNAYAGVILTQVKTTI